MTFDLHLHSDASDGEATLAVVAQAIAANRTLARVSLTDHDTVDPSLALAAIEPRAWIGAELTSYVGSCRIDMLAVGLRPDDTTLSGYLATRVTERRARFALFGDLLRADGWVFDPLPATWARAQLAQPHVVAELRRHAANLARLLAMGIPTVVPEGVDDPVYNQILGPLAPIIRARTEASVAESPAMVDRIHAAGGLAFVAHPWVSPYDNGNADPGVARGLLAPIIAAGVDGLELWHPAQRDPVAHQTIAAIVAAHGLLTTAGSDDHSADLRWLGTSSPTGPDAEVTLARIEAALARRRAIR